MPATESRNGLIAAILAFVGEGGQDLLALEDIRAQLERELQAAGDTAILALTERLTEDFGWAYYPPDPLARRIHHLLASRFLTVDSVAHGLEHLPRAARNVPLIIVANHLSYADANVVEVLLQRGGASAIAERLTAVAGPKVFTSRQRRFSSLCFGTIKVPQSADVASGEAVLNPRDVARAARRAIEVAHVRLGAGDTLLLFPEGTRSRSAAMQAMLPAVARYLEFPGAVVVPAGLTGSESLFPVDGALRAARVTVTFGEPVPAADLLVRAGRDRRGLMDRIGSSVAALLPPSYRGVYAG
jgi:1-acyl-sn-glycerol-3-phosphate acyltransferase